MRIEQFKYSTDNFGYLVYSGNQGIAIDPGAVDNILAFSHRHGIEITHVANTHSHYDHTPGNKAMLEKTGASFLDSRKITSHDTITIGKKNLEVFPTPGHTEDCITFKADDFIVTGDTLFNGTVGNCFSGDLYAFYLSIRRLASLPAHTRIFAGHDYVKEAIAFAKTIEPDNPDMDRYMEKYDPNRVVSTMADEFKVNSYLRYNTPGMIDRLKSKKMPVETEFDRFKSIMEVY